MSRGTDLHNPFDIEHSSIIWEGQAPVQSDPTLVEFVNDFEGLRAGFRDLLTAWRRGLNTPAKLIPHYAPPDENPTETYIENLCDWCGVQADDTLNFGDNAFLKQWGLGMLRQEQGAWILTFYPDALIDQAVEAAYATS